MGLTPGLRAEWGAHLVRVLPGCLLCVRQEEVQGLPREHPDVGPGTWKLPPRHRGTQGPVPASGGLAACARPGGCPGRSASSRRGMQRGTSWARRDVCRLSRLFGAPRTRAGISAGGVQGHRDKPPRRGVGMGRGKAPQEPSEPSFGCNEVRPRRAEGFYSCSAPDLKLRPPGAQIGEHCPNLTTPPRLPLWSKGRESSG